MHIRIKGMLSYCEAGRKFPIHLSQILPLIGLGLETSKLNSAGNTQDPTTHEALVSMINGLITRARFILSTGVSVLVSFEEETAVLYLPLFCSKALFLSRISLYDLA